MREWRALGKRERIEASSAHLLFCRELLRGERKRGEEGERERERERGGGRRTSLCACSAQRRTQMNVPESSTQMHSSSSSSPSFQPHLVAHLNLDDEEQAIFLVERRRRERCLARTGRGFAVAAAAELPILFWFLRIPPVVRFFFFFVRSYRKLPAWLLVSALLASGFDRSYDNGHCHCCWCYCCCCCSRCRRLSFVRAPAFVRVVRSACFFFFFAIHSKQHTRHSCLFVDYVLRGKERWKAQTGNNVELPPLERINGCKRMRKLAVFK